MWLLLSQVHLKLFYFVNKTICSVNTQFSLTFTILYCLAEIEQALILSNILNVLLNET